MRKIGSSREDWHGGMETATHRKMEKCCLNDNDDDYDVPNIFLHLIPNRWIPIRN